MAALSCPLAKGGQIGWGGVGSVLALPSSLQGAHPKAVAVRASSSSRWVVVTREKGKNQKLMNLLHTHGISSLELPLIGHKEGPDFGKLPSVIRENNFDWIVITSPEAALVFLEGWKLAGSPNAKLAVVGSGTGQVFENIEADNAKLAIDFVPSKANAKNLAEELPKVSMEGGKVLYPASAKASHELETGLLARGFEVIRLNTYSTDSVKVIDPSVLALAVAAPVVALASPTAVRAWVDLIDLSTWVGAAACIGQTSAVAAQKAGLKRVFYPDNPGIDGWVQSILDALETQNCGSAP